MGDLAEIQKLFADFSKDVLAKIDIVHTQLANVNVYLSTMEKGRSAKEVAEKFKREKQLLTIKLEIATRDAMEKVGRDFLKAQTDNSNTQAIPEIAAKLEAKLFCKEEPKPEICPHKLAFATYDGEDPFPWLNWHKQFFKGQRTPKSQKTWYGFYHLTGTAQQWYMRLSQDTDVMDWVSFAWRVNERFGPPTRCSPLGELASLRKTGTVDGYMECFLAHVARAGNLDEC
jgi:hypothetical protein